MQEVFEKMMDRLKERTSFLSDCTKHGNKDAEQQNKSYSTMMMYEVADLVDDLIGIINQTVAEYGDGWIPCSERLPECCGYPVLLTVENTFGQRSVCKAFTNYMKEGKLLFYTNEKEYCSGLSSSKLSEAWKPIAWQPLPETYSKGE